MTITTPRTVWYRIPDGREVWLLFTPEAVAVRAGTGMLPDPAWAYACGHAYGFSPCQCEQNPDTGAPWTASELRAFRQEVNTVRCWACRNRDMGAFTDAVEGALLMPSHPERGS